jgi:Telomere resolvase
VIGNALRAIDPDHPALSARRHRSHQRFTKDALNKEVKIAFGQGDLSWKPGHLRRAYGAICCHRFKPKNMTDDIFLAQILGHKLVGPNASLSVGQSYKDFYVVGEAGSNI